MYATCMVIYMIFSFLKTWQALSGVRCDEIFYFPKETEQNTCIFTAAGCYFTHVNIDSYHLWLIQMKPA